MNKYFISLIVFVLLSNLNICSQPQNVSGIVYFDDGRQINFNNITNIVAVNKTEIEVGKSQRGYLKVFFENTWRLVPFSKLKKIRIVEYKILDEFDNCIIGTMEITTVTGVTVRTSYDAIWSIYIEILDKLTGEIKELEFPFKKPGIKELSIREIILNN